MSSLEASIGSPGTDDNAVGEIGPEPLPVAAAVDGAFGAQHPPGSVLAGAALIGAPPYQFRVLLLCGIAKVALQMAGFVQIFTHGKYNPPSCEIPRADWPPPKRGSIAFEWALCCQQKWKLGMVSSAYFAGSFVGAFVGGLISDCVGRRPVILSGMGTNAACLLLSAAAPRVVAYAVLRFFAGAANIAALMANFTLAVEWVPEGWRSPLSGFLFACSAAGELALVPVALAVAQVASLDWRPLTAAVGVASMMPVPVLWLALPESPRWLHARRRYSDAVAALAHAAQSNAEALGDRTFAQVAQALRTGGLAESGLQGVNRKGLSEANGGLQAAVRRVATWAMGLLWFTASLAYYGISLAAGVLNHGLGLYASAAMSACSEMPAALLAAWMLEQRWLGRRLATTSLYLLGGGLCIALPFAPDLLIPILAILGKLFLTAAFDGIYVYASEVFETTIRGSAMGFCSCAARIGSISAAHVDALLTENQVMVCFGFASLLSATACRTLLPETLQTTDAKRSEDSESECWTNSKRDTRSGGSSSSCSCSSSSDSAAS